MNGGKSHVPTERADEMLLVRYLLGNLTEEEQVQVEDRAFADAEYLGVLEAVEADLIDTYVRGELPAADRQAFERRFLASPQRRSKVEFARALARVAQETRAVQTGTPPTPSAWQSLIGVLRGWNPVLQFAAGVAALVLIAGAAWLTIQNGAMRSQMAALEAQRRGAEQRESDLKQQLDQERARSGSLAAQLQQQTPSPVPRTPLLASLVLLPGLSRAESNRPQLVIASTVQLAHIEIQLEARDDYPRFRAELRTGSGEEILVRGNLRKLQTPAGSSVALDVPSSALPAGEYELALKGIADGRAVDIGYYYFRVQKP